MPGRSHGGESLILLRVLLRKFDLVVLFNRAAPNGFTDDVHVLHLVHALSQNGLVLLGEGLGVVDGVVEFVQMVVRLVESFSFQLYQFRV